MHDYSKGIFVARQGEEVFVRVVGRGSFQNSQPLRQFGGSMIRDGCRKLRVDLARCEGMDSTFLGVLAGFGLSLHRSGTNGLLRVINAGKHSVQSLRTLGLERVMKIDETDAGGQSPAESDFRQLPGSDLSETASSLNHTKTAKLMLEAHEALCSADDRNEARFQIVKECLREDIARVAGLNTGDSHTP